MQENILINKIKNRIISFLSLPMEDKSMTFFRLSIGGIALIHILSIYDFSPFLFGENAVIKPEINRAVRTVLGNYFFNIDLHNIITLFFTGIPEDEAIKVFLCFYSFILGFYMLGFLTSFFAIIAWICNIILINSYQLDSYGFDMFLNNALFLSIFFPLSTKHSLDYFLFKRRTNILLLNASVFTLKYYLSFVYFFSSISKMKSIQWWNGEAIWRCVMQPPFNGFDMSFLSNYSYVLPVLSVSVLLIEFFYPFFIFNKKFKNITAFLAISLHVGIAVFLGLYFFSCIMIAFNITVLISRKPTQRLC